MRKFIFLWVALVVLVFQVGFSANARADAAGRLTLVEGRVDVLKGGKLPATPLKVGDEVQTGDVLRSKSLSRAEITFVDNSTMKIAPGSRVAIEEYMYNPAQKKRSAVIQLFSGLAHVVVQKITQVAEPDFVVKTNTAIMGVRGTNFGIRLQPNSSTILNFEGRLQVGNIFPEVSQLSRRAAKIAVSWGPGAQHWVILNNMQGTVVGLGAPIPPFPVTQGVQNTFNAQMIGGLISQTVHPTGGGTATAGGTSSGHGSEAAGSGKGSGSSSGGTCEGTGGSGTASCDTGAGGGGTGGGSTTTFISSYDTAATGSTGTGSLGTGNLPTPSGIATTSGAGSLQSLTNNLVTQTLTQTATQQTMATTQTSSAPTPPPPLPPPPRK
jgi:hypothetical protein